MLHRDISIVSSVCVFPKAEACVQVGTRGKKKLLETIDVENVGQAENDLISLHIFVCNLDIHNGIGIMVS